MTRLRVDRGVTDRVRTHVKRIRRFLETVSPLKKAIHIRVVAFGACSYSEADRDVFCYAFTQVPYRGERAVKSRPTRIFVAGSKRPYSVGFSFCHEWVHCEQERDKKPLTERGVNQRATSLYSRFLRQS
jgi:hypothetical protein